MSPVVDHPSQRRRTSRWFLAGCIGCAVLALLGGLAVVAVGYFYFEATRSAAPPPVVVLPPTPPGARVLRERWTYRFGAGQGLAIGNLDADGKPDVVLSARDGGVVLNRSGGQPRKLSSATADHLMVGRRKVGGGLLIGFDTWNQSLDATDAAGKVLWTYRVSDAVDWAAPVDLGDPRGDCVAVGYNGTGGLHILDPTGKLRTRVGGLANVWCVAPLRRGKGAPAAIACVEAGGTVHVYDAAGKLVNQMKAAGYLSKLATADLDGDGADEILAIGSGPGGGVLTAFSGKGATLWQYPSPATAGLEPELLAVGRFLRTGRQLAIGGADGSVVFLDAKGMTVAQQNFGHRLIEIAALENPSAPRDGLVILSPVTCDYYTAK